MLPTVKIAGSLAQNAGFSASTCLVSSRLFFCGVAVSMREAGKPVLFECVQAGCHVVLRGRRGTLSRMRSRRSKGSRFTLGVWGLRVCVRSTLRLWSQPFATVRNRPQPFVWGPWPCLCEVLQRWSFLEVSDVWLLRFAWQAWHFVTFRHVLERVESRFAWQAQYFCDVF